MSVNLLQKSRYLSNQKLEAKVTSIYEFLIC